LRIKLADTQSTTATINASDVTTALRCYEDTDDFYNKRDLIIYKFMQLDKIRITAIEEDEYTITIDEAHASKAFYDVDMTQFDNKCAVLLDELFPELNQ
jgi:hypothetical protein